MPVFQPLVGAFCFLLVCCMCVFFLTGRCSTNASCFGRSTAFLVSERDTAKERLSWCTVCHLWLRREGFFYAFSAVFGSVCRGNLKWWLIKHFIEVGMGRHCIG